MSACTCRTCGDAYRVVTVTLYGPDDKAFEVTADVSRDGDVQLWTRPEDMDMAELAAALGMFERDVRLSILEAA